MNIAEVEFDAIKSNLKSYLKQQAEFQDYNFEGSAISAILDVLAYSLHYMGFYYNMNATEMFFTLAQNRKNVVNGVKSVNYIPRRKTGSVSDLTISVKTAYRPVPVDAVITISKYTTFVAQGVYFFVTQEYTLTSANSYTTNIEIRQGIYREGTYVSTGEPSQALTIRNASIDEETLEVYVDDVLWTNENNITTLDGDSTSYQVELDDDNYVVVRFGDDVIGKIPDTGATIAYKYTETVGLDGNEYSVFALNQILEDNYGNLYDNSKVTLTTINAASGGADYESLASIKANAPKFYEAQNRWVTKNDYIATLTRHQLVEGVNVWGGDEITGDPKYGKVYIAVKPVGGLNLTEEQITTLTVYLNELNVVTITPVFVPVTYLYADIEGTIYYYQQYESNLTTVRSDVETEMQDFFDELPDFQSMFKNAKFTTAINNLEKIANTNLTIKPYLYFSKSGTNTYVLETGNTITAGTVLCDIITGTLNEGFYDDGSGNILTKKSGNAIIGEMNYTTGIVEIYPGYAITATEPTNGFRMDFSTPNSDVFYRQQRSILLGQMNLIYTRYV